MKTETIIMPKKDSFDSEVEYSGILFHEMTHSTGHKTRLSREGITKGNHFGDEFYIKEELIGEVRSAFLCEHANISPATLTSSASSISGWLKQLRNDKKLVIQAGSAAQKPADHILGPSTLETAEF